MKLENVVIVHTHIYSNLKENKESQEIDFINNVNER